MDVKGEQSAKVKITLAARRVMQSAGILRHSKAERRRNG
jgi:hypothetical protein